jgi:hypothetical protein
MKSCSGYGARWMTPGKKYGDKLVNRGSRRPEQTPAAPSA